MNSFFFPPFCLSPVLFLVRMLFFFLSVFFPCFFFRVSVFFSRLFFSSFVFRCFFLVFFFSSCFCDVFSLSPCFFLLFFRCLQVPNTPGKKALAMEAYARALRQLPTIIADNGGFDGSELISSLRAAHAKGAKASKNINIYIYNMDHTSCRVIFCCPSSFACEKGGGRMGLCVTH